MLLGNKVAVIYRAGDAVGGVVARAFAREGAGLFLNGRHRAPVETVAKEIVSAGEAAETAEVDVLDKQAVDSHLQSEIDKAGCVEISFNAIGIPNTTLQGVPLIDLAVEQFSQPIATYTRSYFLTARLATWRMVAKRSGAIMTVTSVPSRMGYSVDGRPRPGDERRRGAHLESVRRTRTSRHSRGWSASQTGCRSRARSRKSSGFTPRRREFRGKSFTKRSRARTTGDGFRRSRRWRTWRPSWPPMRRAR
jgi:NAD(P)-dependent dehydrogenase (short-subunit alcohol dehydrogenase family)